MTDRDDMEHVIVHHEDGGFGDFVVFVIICCLLYRSCSIDRHLETIEHRIEIQAPTQP